LWPISPFSATRQEIKLNEKEPVKDPSELSKALEAISTFSRGLPSTAPPPENPRYSSYGPPNSVDEGVRLRDVWMAISKRRWLIVFIVLLVTATTSVILARRPDIYSAETEVQVDMESVASGLTSGKGNAIILGTGTDPSYFNTQLQVLTKPGLLRRVVKTLDLEHNPDFLRGQTSDTTWQRLLRTFGLGPASTAQTPGQKTDSGKLLIHEVASPTSRDDLEEAARLEPFVTAIQAGLKVEPVREERLEVTDTRLISIRFTHPSPLVAAKVTNTIADTFVLSNLEQKTKSTSTTGDFLQQRVAELQSQIRTDEERLINYAKGHEILSLDAGQNIVVERLSGLNRQLLEAENERKMAQADYRVSREPGAADALAAAGTREMEDQLAALKQKREQLLVENTEEWPEVKDVVKQIAVLEKQIQETHSRVITTALRVIETRYHQTLEREQALRKAFDEQRSATLTQNESAINYHIIEQETQTNKGLLDGLLQRAKENDVILAATPNNIHVTDYAIAPRVPIGPKRFQGILLAFAFSIGFGVCLATMLEYLDDSVRSTEDVGRILRLPALAVIPAIGRLASRRRRLKQSGGDGTLQLGNGNGDSNGNGKFDKVLILDGDQRSPLAEAYRQLRTSVLLSSAGQAPKTLLVTSCIAAEGKTTTSINLAVTLAQTGANVLIIDADMRRPRIHSIFGISNQRGLCNILAKDMSEAEILTLVHQEAESGLYLLTSGPIPPNPAELIGSAQMRNLIASLRKTFDHIVIDSPPIATFTDGVLLSALSDGVIMVIHANKCSRKVAQRSHQTLQEVGAKVLGVVLNNVDSHSPDYYYYKYQYDSYYKSHKHEENGEPV
jgi:capsular exopolysaccharide synthesis family protein